MDWFELELQNAIESLPHQDLQVIDLINFEIERAKERALLLVESWQLDDVSETILKQKITVCKTMYDIDALQTVFFHFAPAPSVFKNVARINSEGKQYWTNAFIDYRKRNGTF